ncbi:T9SS type A sorting domain-containing protein [bacterium SCSIO 12643]|nr:T9SS type A sorting domain-containing protein [bacterium SCSIO 12643]
MKIFTSLFLFLLTSIIGFSQIGVYPNEENLRSDTIDVLDYEIHLDITDFSNQSLSGYTVVKCTPLLSNVNSINLDLLHFNIDSILLNHNLLTYQYNDTLLHVNLGSSFNVNDTLNIEVYYHGTTRKDPSGWGGVYFGSDYAFNLGVGFEDRPHNIGRYWFPCFDNFKERSTYNIYLTTPSTHYGTSIGELVSSTPLPNNKVEWYWKLDETIPTYLSMFAVNYYTIVHDNYVGLQRTIPIDLFAKSSDTNNLKASFANLKAAMDAFENLYGPYQFNKIGYTVVNFSSGAMEHASNITYPNNTVDGTLNSETLMAHELAHQWWGNYATTLTPEDMWLNEGMASFSANYFLEAVYGWETAKPEVKSILYNILKKAHIDEGGYLAISGVPHSLTYGDHVYRKGALVAQNLRMLLGESNFGPAVTGFLNSRAFQNMSSLQLRDYLQNTTSRDVDGFFDGWVFNGGFPDYKIDSVISVPNNNLYDVTIHVSQRLNHAPQQFSEIPLEIGFYDDTFGYTTKEIMVGPNSSTLTTTLSYDPSMVTLNPNNKLCYATTDDIHVIKTTGQINYNNAMMTVNVSSVNDSALLKIEHHWSAPDHIKDWANQPYLLSNYRYWKIDGIWSSNFEASAGFFYDGRQSNGYLDSLLVKNTEDSLVVLYRQNAADDWVEYPHYTKNTLGGSNNMFGRIELTKLLKGEYTLANIDHSVLGLTPTIQKDVPEIRVYPNPSNEKITIAWNSSLKPNSIEIYSLNGTRVLSISPNQSGSQSFNTKVLKQGNYIAKVIFDNESYSSQFTVLKD